MYVANCTNENVDYAVTGGGGELVQKYPLDRHQITKDSSVMKDRLVTFYERRGRKKKIDSAWIQDEHCLVILDEVHGARKALVFCLSTTAIVSTLADAVGKRLVKSAEVQEEKDGKF